MTHLELLISVHDCAEYLKYMANEFGEAAAAAHDLSYETMVSGWRGTIFSEIEKKWPSIPKDEAEFLVNHYFAKAPK